MKPPPPMLPALGWVTASANAVATAASTAFPPLARMAAPASHAGADVHTTSPSLDETPSSLDATTARCAGSASKAIRGSATVRSKRVMAAAYTGARLDERAAVSEAASALGAAILLGSA